MINKIIEIIKKINLKREKFISVFKNYKYSKNYNIKEYENKQNLIYRKQNLDRSEALKKLNLIKNKYNFLNHNMSSEHEVIFSALSINHNFSNILEIGTFNAANAFLLSRLFPKTKILTIDLDDTENSFKNSYNRNQKNKLIEFINQRNIILNKSENITFKQMNSINLFNHNGKYDLIWIDGAHGYPTVTVDIINSLKLTKANSIIMCDDIIIKKLQKQDSLYVSVAAHETLEILKKEGIIESTYFYKRLDPINNANFNKRKFIAYFTLKK